MPLMDCPFSRLTKRQKNLRGRLIVEGPIPREKAEDALHIALAARDGMDYLLTWNFTHIHNAQMEMSIRRIVEQYGYRCPVFCSPDELIGEKE